jgi:hypothetical protein
MNLFNKRDDAIYEAQCNAVAEWACVLEACLNEKFKYVQNGNTKNGIRFHDGFFELVFHLRLNDLPKFAAGEEDGLEFQYPTTVKIRNFKSVEREQLVLDFRSSWGKEIIISYPVADKVAAKIYETFESAINQ